MPSRTRFSLPLLALLAICQLASPAAAARDPLEPVNRRIHALNQGLQAWLLGPAVELYMAATTPGFRTGLSNALGNLGEPVSAVSSIAAGDFGRAANAALRFGINTTLGVGGIHDAATPLGFPRRPLPPADAVCSWGVPSGPFLVLPLLGPSTLRDAGTVALTSAALSQLVGQELFLGWRGSDLFTGYANVHHELRRIDAEALDSYAIHRSAYLQRRAAACAVDRHAATEAEEVE
ncbi:VacJ family lipoprotein [Falsiroseomonas sp.]|uniref:MlaA family lipoprotein n=1 Tax=Falsiroseomonas sp. TaxID=2870721 RepID=UPI00356B4ECA